MDAVPESFSATGLVRLLEHCEAMGRITAGEGASPRGRLEDVLGSELAARLVGALARRVERASLVL